MISLRKLVGELRFQFLVSALAAVLAFAMTATPLSAHAKELNEAAFEKKLREEKRDFERVVTERKRARQGEAEALEALQAERKRNDERKEKLRAEYAKTSPRYSMEEVEARDRADEKRLEEELAKKETGREAYAADRKREREIRTWVGEIDGNEEFDIDFAKAPESKVSSPSKESEAGSGGSSGGGGFGGDY